jgi:hypothetical protein
VTLGCSRKGNAGSSTNTVPRLLLSSTRLCQQNKNKETNNFKSIINYLVCEAIGTAAGPGLLFQPRVIVKMIVEKQMECRLAGESEVLGENLPQRYFCPSQNPQDQTRV